VAANPVQPFRANCSNTLGRRFELFRKLGLAEFLPLPQAVIDDRSSAFLREILTARDSTQFCRDSN
jgi:hypothetical protein